jgi:hypothetical protein
VHRVFYSWQSDTDERVNCSFIRGALDEAIRRLDLDLELDEATRDMPGSKMIFEAIRRKIESCAILVPDMTFIGQSGNGKKRLPNPNVLIEYGYALANIDEDRIVPVMNVHFGEISRLPFDLQHRPIKVAYDLSPDASEVEVGQKQEELVVQFEREIRLVFASGALFKGLSPSAVKIVKHVVEQSETGWPVSQEYEVEELASVLGLDAGETNKLLKQLAALGYVERLKLAGTDAPPVKPTDLLFWDFDSHFKGWNPRKDANTVVETMTKGGRRGVNCEALAQELGWEIRRINPALRYLESAHLVLPSKNVSYPLAVIYMSSTERTEGFIAGLIDPEKLARRGGF